MPAHLLVVGVDAMEATIIEQGIASGRCPTLARLAAEGDTFRLTNPLHSFPGAIWPEINTGRSAEQLGLFFHPSQVHTGEAVPRPVDQREIDPELDWWHIASSAGRRVLVFDVPQTVANAGTNGIQITDWDTHDRTWAPAVQPPGLWASLEGLTGPPTTRTCDQAIGGSVPDAHRAFLRQLLERVEARTRSAVTLMGRETWDVAHVAFAEAHCVGHQFWAFADPTHPVVLPERPAELEGAITTVYEAIDAAVGRLIAAAGTTAHVMVFTSHGMGPYIGGYQLLPEVLTRMGLRGASHPMAAAPTRLPAPIRSLLRRVVPDRLRWARIAYAGNIPSFDLVSPRTQATTMVNNRCGAVRLNLRGREPSGTVEPGTEAEVLLDRIEAELRSLGEPASREPIVSAVSRPCPGAHADLPDLIVDFRTDLGRLEVADSPRLGRIEVPIWDRAVGRNGWPKRLGRSGDHTAESRLWLLPAGGTENPGGTGTGSVRDIAPTALSLLGVDAPTGIEGRSLR